MNGEHSRLAGMPGSRRLAAAILLVVAAGSGHAQEACKMEMNVKPMTLSAIYDKAEKIAKSWQPDVVLAQIANTTLGPLDSEGESETWRLMFYSASANAHVDFTTFRGMFTCHASAGAAGRIPDLAPGFLRDGAKLYAIAKEKGGDLLAQGHGVSIQTGAKPDTRHAEWFINFHSKSGAVGRTVIVDANTGAVTQVTDR